MSYIKLLYWMFIDHYTCTQMNTILSTFCSFQRSWKPLEQALSTSHECPTTWPHHRWSEAFRSRSELSNALAPPIKFWWRHRTAGSEQFNRKVGARWSFVVLQLPRRFHRLLEHAFKLYTTMHLCSELTKSLSFELLAEHTRRQNNV